MAKLVRCGCAVLCLVPLVVSSALAAEPALPLGVVREQPAEGRFVKTARGYMVPYKAKIPGTDVEFEMLPIPGGKFKMGSPSGEVGRGGNEGPQFEVAVEPFWMGKCEVTWAEYRQFMALYALFKKFQGDGLRRVTKDNEADAVTAPSELYDSTFTFEKGDKPRLPAVSMSQYAAKQYTKWLSGLSGQFYRLPDEAEWEYACRAGTTTAYSFGDDPAAMKDYGWNFDNSDDTPHDVGKKKPNPWGLFDMHGNVAEWCLDEVLDDGYKRFDGKSVGAAESVAWPTKLFPRAIRGGAWDSEPKDCRSAARIKSHDREWKETDPNSPKSPWWFTDGMALSLGFRIVRPLAEPAKDQRGKYWDADHQTIRDAVTDRLNQGRGAAGVADGSLQDAIRKASAP